MRKVSWNRKTALEKSIQSNLADYKVRTIAAYIAVTRDERYKKLVQTTDVIELQQLVGELRALEKLSAIVSIPENDPLYIGAETVV